jgi:hypothetical protein
VADANLYFDFLPSDVPGAYFTLVSGVTLGKATCELVADTRRTKCDEPRQEPMRIESGTPISAPDDC